MKKTVCFLVIFLPVSLFVAGCKNPVNFDGIGGIDLNFNERVVVTATFENGNGLATIGSLSVTWDGQALQDSAPPSPVMQIAVSGIRLGKEKGTHHLSFRIANQTSSPNTYQVRGLVITSYDQDGGVVARLTPDPQTELLDTNDAISFDFRL